jgi:RHS repeat-associated protein
MSAALLCLSVLAHLACLQAGEAPPVLPGLHDAPPMRLPVPPASSMARRTLPVHDPVGAPPALEATTPDAIAAAHVLLDEALLPCPSDRPSAVSGLARVLAAYTMALPGQRDMRLLRRYMVAHPDSPYVGAIQLNLGCEAVRQGYFDDAAQAYEAAWDLLRRGQGADLQALANRALVEWMAVLAWGANFERIDELLPTAKSRDMVGIAERRLTAIETWRVMMRTQPAEGSLCGPYAVSELVKQQQPLRKHEAVEQALRSVLAGVISAYANGMSSMQRRGANLREVQAVANGLSCPLQAVKRIGHAQLPVPSIVHWRQHHFSAVLEQRGDQYRIEDPAMSWFGSSSKWISQDAMLASSSGFALIPVGPLPAGWELASETEATDVWGRGVAGGSPTDSPGMHDPATCPIPAGDTGMPSWSYSWAHVALQITDRPLFYTPAAGPVVSFRVRYSEADTSQPAVPVFSNLGPKWNCDWQSTVTITAQTQDTMTAVVQLRGGGVLTQPMYPLGTLGAYTQTYVGGYDMYRNPPPPSGSGGHALFGSPSYSTIRQVGLGLTIDMAAQTATLNYGDGRLDSYIARPSAGGGQPTLFYLNRSYAPSGQYIQFSYDAQYRLIGVTDTLGQVTTVGYELSTDPLKMTTITDPFGRQSLITYDNGRLSSIRDMAGLTSSVIYSTASGDIVSSLITPYGTTNFSRGIGVYGYYDHWIESLDAQGDRERMEAKGHAWPLPHAMDPLGLPTGTRIPIADSNYTSSSNVFFWNKKSMKLGNSGNYDQAELKQYAWSSGPSTYLVTSTKTPSTGRVYYIYPGQMTWPYPSGVTLGLPDQVARVLDDGTTQIQNYSWSQTGQLLMAQDPLGRQTHMSYAANGIDLQHIYQGMVGMAAGDRSFLASFGYDAAHNITSVVDASGRTTTFGYNALHQLTTATLPQRAGQPVEQVHLTYDATTKQLTGVQDQAGTTTLVHMDAKGRLDTVTSIDGHTVTMQYDDLDRLLQRVYPDGTYEQIGYDRLDPVWMRDREGHWTRTWYNLIRKPVAVRDPQGQVTLFDWCRCGSLKRITDPQGRVTTWDYDADGHLLKKVYPDGRQSLFAYGPRSGRLTSITDAKGQVMNVTYHSDDRVATIAYTNAIVPTSGVSLGYDALFGRLLGLTDGTGTTTFAYTPYATAQPSPTVGLGRLCSIDGPLSNDTVTMGYDEQGRVVASTLNGVATTWTLDRLGRMTSLTNPLGVSALQYVGNSGRLSQVTAGNGMLSQFGYLGVSQDLRVQSILHSVGGNRITENTYSYTPTGQIATWTRQYGTSGLEALVPTYDQTDQVTGVDIHSGGIGGAVSQALSYVYDASGNRLSATTRQGTNLTVQSAAFNALNQLTQLNGAGGKMRVRGHLDEPGTVAIQGNDVPVRADKSFSTVLDVTAGTSTFTVQATDLRGNSATQSYQVTAGSAGTARDVAYDLNGNCTSDGLRTYTWDAADRLASITQGTDVTVFTYDGLGRRVRQVELADGVTVADRTFVWVGATIAEERTNAGATTVRYFGNGMQIVSGTKAGFYTYARDHLGSIQAITDATGAVRAQYGYTPWGERTKLSGDVDTDEGFTGHWHHRSGLVLTWFRAYDPTTGRWLSRDPIGERGGLNLYGYIVNNPLNDTDPLGLWPPGYDNEDDWHADMASRGHGGWYRFANRVGWSIAALADPYNDELQENANPLLRAFGDKGRQNTATKAGTACATGAAVAATTAVVALAAAETAAAAGYFDVAGSVAQRHLLATVGNPQGRWFSQFLARNIIQNGPRATPGSLWDFFTTLRYGNASGEVAFNFWKMTITHYLPF